jgi:hypothetical protein
MRSVTFKRSKQFETPLGLFEYQSIPRDFYVVGFEQFITDDYVYLIATPEKALCDYLFVTANLKFTSKKSMLSFLEDDLRVDFSAVKWNTKLILKCAKLGKKTKALLYLKEVLDECV